MHKLPSVLSQQSYQGTPPAMMCDNTCEGLPTQGAHPEPESSGFL